ncbi:MAG: tetraacyldisaccharide 4'-kinase [Aquabacterium sp.]
MSLASHLASAWMRRGPLACALWPLSMLMRGIVAARRAAYHRGWLSSVRLPVPVLVVGNRVAGGAGKTPTTMALLSHLQSQGWHPGVLTRGYKALATEGGASLLIDDRNGAELDGRTTGDEPLLIWRRTRVPIMVARDRAAGGHALLKAHPEVDVLVCDDGLQHLRLQRDLEIIVFDERGQGNGWLLPAGPLREPIDAAPPAGLVTPPIVLYNAAHTSTSLPGHLARRGMAPLLELAAWWAGRPATGASRRAPPQAGDTVGALAGIAHPQRFFDALTAMGLNVRGIPLDDHADFTTLPWPEDVRQLIVTEKDAVKLPPDRIARERPRTTVWVAALDFAPEPSFWNAVDAALASLRRQYADGHTTH